MQISGKQTSEMTMLIRYSSLAASGGMGTGFQWKLTPRIENPLGCACKKLE